MTPNEFNRSVTIGSAALAIVLAMMMAAFMVCSELRGIARAVEAVAAESRP